MREKKQKATKTKAPPTPPPAVAGKRPAVPKIRNMRSIAAARVVVWVILGFVLLRGLWGILFPADVERLAGELAGSIAKVQGSLIPDREAAAFAEGFAREYFTYTARRGEDYQKRLGSYCGSRLAGDICEGVILKGAAKAVYVSAVDITPYSDAQQDITVLAVTEHLVEEPVMLDGKKTLREATVIASTYLTVPVYLSPTGYLVEDMPLVTAPPPSATDYQPQEFAGTPADERVKGMAGAMLEDFFKTLYCEGQQRIDYYLTEDASRLRLREIRGSMKFVRVEALSVYKGTAADHYFGLVMLRLEDTGGTVVKQRLNITLVESGSRLYVKEIGLRSHNLKD